MSVNVTYDPLEYELYFLKKLGINTNKINNIFEAKIFDKKRDENEKRKNKLLSKKTGEGFGVCSKCKSTDNSLIPIQTRSADEPIDFIIICNSCGHRWHAG